MQDPIPNASADAASKRPIMRLLDLVGRRWSLRVLWELRGAPLRSRALRTACDGVSPTVLQARIDELRAAQLVALTPEGYALTATGRAFLTAFEPLYVFAETWAAEADRETT
ncbi:MAG: helix-turn-helix transcriptional regulator [Alphaproteobacteria bacterium]|nr:helix-turn-helix transcriptional regulator [Alphaproteobacteria bacterium]